MWYAILADFVIAIHVAYVGYVVVGQLAIWLGLLLRCRWARNFWFRVTHLIAILIVGFEAVFDITCPLTIWEDGLRRLAGQNVDAQISFLGRLFRDVLRIEGWPHWVFEALHIGMAVVVLGTFIAFPPRRPRWLGGKPLTA